MKLHTMSRLVAGLVIGCASHSAFASNISFAGLSGLTGSAFGTYAESGFTVSAAFGDWREAHAFGAPEPSIYVEDLRSAPFGGLAVTNGGLFTFDSVDLSAYASAAGYEITGWLGGATVFDVAGSEGTGVFDSILGGSSALIDRLTIDVSSAGPGSFNIDNIRVSAVSPVPEPGSYGLMLLGLGMLGGSMRRRSRAGGCDSRA